MRSGRKPPTRCSDYLVEPFLLSPAGLLTLVAIIRHSERVTMAFIATMATKTS